MIEAKTKLIEDKNNEIETKNKEIEAKNKEIEAKTKVIEANTKMIEAKCVSEIELVKAKCLSEAEIIELIEAQDDCRNDPCQNGQCVDLENDYRCECHTGYSGRNCDSTCLIDNPLFREVDGVCLR